MDPNYIQRHEGVTWDMRALMVDELVHLQYVFDLLHETLHLAIKMVDLYFTKTTKPVPLDRLKTLTISAMFTAAKYEVRGVVSSFSNVMVHSEIEFRR